uniref:Uncharacterized protein n=1 Tax=Rhizophagus irregularis (strain DAOM 181602 / DAOM 197198 / MUCL 43194) TaxID=747089 RepID=U9SY81_RHIID
MSRYEPDLMEQDNDELIPEESLDKNQISKVGALTADGRIKDKMARSMIYKEI